MPPGPPLTDQERDHLARVVDTLARRFQDTPRDTVQQYVDESLARFRDARITVHLPVLVERAARERLLERRGQQALTSA
jgi:Protein of unknown function (DUF3562)